MEREQQLEAEIRKEESCIDYLFSRLDIELDHRNYDNALALNEDLIKSMQRARKLKHEFNYMKHLQSVAQQMQADGINAQIIFWPKK
ncbi:hypothetical protein [Alkalibacillus almallahensis]|uniref:hypothetical protein n=1 Tax=Alkalibacillus almallahensis TaxID=1379154 RepID=UPI00142329F1|nr:hypothetical protein [Alkalibacillus almallahensis]NIK12840.1 ribosomal 50S subunit-associated protein YjgA (DUF615 family) [Alkalibacillus almallahensis]